MTQQKNTRGPLGAPTKATVHGFPRQGPGRELKKAVEGHWAGRVSAAELDQIARDLRARAWSSLTDRGIAEVPTGDFSYYDHVLDTTVMVDAIPARYREAGGEDALATYFAMARGNDAVAPLEMTKWFDTNYHYLVPELGPDTVFTARPERQVEHFTEATGAGHQARPVLVGPFTYLSLAKASGQAPEGFEPLDLLEPLVEVYGQVLSALAAAGAEWVQLDEPALVTDLSAQQQEAFTRAYARLGELSDRPKLVVAAYFGALADNLDVLAQAPVEGVAVDLTGPGAADLPAITAGAFAGKRVIAGVVDGRNVWAADLDAALDTLESLTAGVGSLDVAPSCSLLHVPIEAARETGLDPELRSWLAFALEKATEVATLAKAVAEGRTAVGTALSQQRQVIAGRARSERTRVPSVREAAAALTDADGRRSEPFADRAAAQRTALGLPLLPTTTIGSFPQTPELRTARAALRRGEIEESAYTAQMQAEVAEVIRSQEELGLDVLVHGEPERNDMVQYFAEQLDGYAATAHGWVQSYGSRCVRPPILFGDIVRPEPMTVGWWSYAQSLTKRPVKGMLTGPVTMLAWSFVRDDQPVADTAIQVALALRAEVSDLEKAGCQVIQVDEPALRETLPLRAADRPQYLDWATRAFRVSTSSVAAATQVHTHMCYAEFGDILAAIDDMDVDVISLEAARSGPELAGELKTSGYAKGVGPGVYDIHSPRVPSADEIGQLIDLALSALPPEQVWVNPDCGLKTRAPQEVSAALANLSSAAKAAREALPAS
ncbi:5-methyltetrahydropteroyltriglutamate--homocysteine S-methyltransferase [Dermacoccaceae bacterium W4C1]